MNGRLFELDRHLMRLERSLEVVGITPPESFSAIAQVAEELAAQNGALLPAGADLGLAILVTPGPYATLAIGAAAGATLCLHTYPLPFPLWAQQYETGQSLVIPDVRQVPASCWPPEIKCRSRMHYFLADRQAGHRESGARALMLDLDENVTETSTSNVLVYIESEGLISPPHDWILPGISLAVSRELAEELGVQCLERRLTVAEVKRADEVLLTSTPYCLLPAVSLDGAPIRDGKPGPLYRKLLSAWNERTGVDLAEQAAKFGR
jgi:branched-subunit amino acid aminotransferase/4-amino-4-deoxychorismate lyase